MTVFVADGYLQVKRPGRVSLLWVLLAARFFRIVERLPLELQMVLCNRASGSARDIILIKRSEESFRRWTEVFVWERR